MKTAQIALVAYAALAALSEFVGDEDVVHDFELLPDEKKAGLIAGVDMLLADADATADARHAAWMEMMLADGWAPGKKFDEEGKIHPRLVAFESLPKKEQAKEKLLLAVVRSMALIEDVAALPPVALPPVAVGSLPVKYIGNRESHKDNLYGTGLEWQPGQVHNVNTASAAKMLAHTDTYQRADGEAPATAATAPVNAEPEKLPAPLPHLEGMNKVELIGFAQQNYGEYFAPDMDEAVMRSTILSLVQARGR